MSGPAGGSRDQGRARRGGWAKGRSLALPKGGMARLAQTALRSARDFAGDAACGGMLWKRELRRARAMAELAALGLHAAGGPLCAEAAKRLSRIPWGEEPRLRASRSGPHRKWLVDKVLAPPRQAVRQVEGLLESGPEEALDRREPEARRTREIQGKGPEEARRLHAPEETLRRERNEKGGEAPA